MACWLLLDCLAHSRLTGSLSSLAATNNHARLLPCSCRRGRHHAAAAGRGTAGPVAGIDMRQRHLRGQQHLPSEPRPPRHGTPRECLGHACWLRNGHRGRCARPDLCVGALPRRRKRLDLPRLRCGRVSRSAARVPQQQGRDNLPG
ncbi:hypothetical protein ACQ4PT_030745 [Festuca glaucescens]